MHLRFHGAHRKRVVVAQHLGDAEVEHFDDLFVLGDFLALHHAREEQIVGLQIAVDDALGVRLGERAQRLARRFDRDVDRKALFAREALAERLAFEQLHRQIKFAQLALPEVEDGDRVGRCEEAIGARFAEKARLAGLVERAVAAQNFHRDVATDRVLTRAVDRAHRSGAKLGEERVAAVQRLADHGVLVGADEIRRAVEGGLVVGTLQRPVREASLAFRTDGPLRAGAGERRRLGRGRRGWRRRRRCGGLPRPAREAHASRGVRHGFPIVARPGGWCKAKTDFSAHFSVTERADALRQRTLI